MDLMFIIERESEKRQGVRTSLSASKMKNRSSYSQSHTDTTYSHNINISGGSSSNSSHGVKRRKSDKSPSRGGKVVSGSGSGRADSSDISVRLHHGYLTDLHMATRLGMGMSMGRLDSRANFHVGLWKMEDSNRSSEPIMSVGRVERQSQLLQQQHQQQPQHVLESVSILTFVVTQVTSLLSSQVSKFVSLWEHQGTYALLNNMHSFTPLKVHTQTFLTYSSLLPLCVCGVSLCNCVIKKIIGGDVECEDVECEAVECGVVEMELCLC